MSSRWVLVFDWDGTLVDTLEIKIRNAGALFSQACGVDPASVEAAYRRHSGLPRRRLFEAISEDLGLPALLEDTFQTLSQDFSERNRVVLTNMDWEQLVPQDTLLALEALTSKGYLLYVSSSAEPDEVRQVAKALRLDHFFASILGSEPGFSKGVEHLNYIQNNSSSSRSQIVYIGDEPADILLGREAGVQTVGKAGTYSSERLACEGADAVIASLTELVSWLNRNEINEA